jgi:hypothetical protein
MPMAELVERYLVGTPPVRTIVLHISVAGGEHIPRTAINPIS